MRIGIAGAGVLGRLLAWQLSHTGHSVEVFDADTDTVRAAGWTAAGMLSPVAELEKADDHLFALGLRSCTLWPQIVANLRLPVTLNFEGSLLLAHRTDAGAAQRLINLLQTKAPIGYEPQPLNAEQLATYEPAIKGPALAWLLPHEGRIHTPEAMTALADQAIAQGVQWHAEHPIARVEPNALHDRDGVSHRFDHVFDVRGTGAKPQLPVRGVRGEVFWLHAPEVTITRSLRLLHPRYSVYMVPRPGSLVVVGASEIETEDRSPVSLRTTVELLSAAHSAIPALIEARIVHTETNLRPALPDNLPLLEQTSGMTRINGLFRHGWLIAPALVEQAIQGIL